jgi:hypothetical protein
MYDANGNPQVVNPTSILQRVFNMFTDSIRVDMSAKDAVNVTPSDTTVLKLTKRLYIGGAGNIKVQMSSGAQPTFAVTAGQMIDLNVTKVLATGTTATGIVALY